MVCMTRYWGNFQNRHLHRERAFMMMSSFIDIDLRRIGRATGRSLEFSLSSPLCLYRLLWTGLPTVGGSGRLKVLIRPLNGESDSGMGFNDSGVFKARFTLPSVILRHRRNTGVVVCIIEVAVDLMLPLMIELKDVGNCALSSIVSMSSNSMQSSSIDSIESDDRLLNDRKQLIDFGDMRAVFGGDAFGGNALGWTNVNLLLLLLKPESMELKSMSWRSSMISFSRNGDSIPISRQELIEHGLGLPCGVLPAYNDISSDDILTGELDESSKFNGAMLSLRPRVAGDILLELMVNAFVMRL